MITTPYDEGHDAYYTKTVENPFQEGTKDALAWDQGYEDAENEDIGEDCYETD